MLMMNFKQESLMSAAIFRWKTGQNIPQLQIVSCCSEEPGSPQIKNT